MKTSGSKSGVLEAVIIGHVCTDINICPNLRYSHWGSPAMYLAKIFSLLPDVSATVVSHFGSDFMQHCCGIDLYPTEPVNSRTLLFKNYIFARSITRTVEFYEDAIPVQIDSCLVDKLNRANLVVVCPILPNFITPYVMEILNAANPNALRVLIPKGYFRKIGRDGELVLREFEEVFEFGNMFDCIIIPRSEHSDIEARMRLWPPQPMHVLTDGVDGVRLITAGRVRDVPGLSLPRSQIADPVGCSDVFAAGFIYSYLKTGDARFSVSIAQQLAIWKTRFTTIELDRINTLPEFMHLLEDYRKYYG